MNFCVSRYSIHVLDLLTSNDALGELHQRLLPATLQNALRTALYRSLWAGRDIATITVETLHELPIVDKATIRQAGTSGQIRSGLICNEIFTSGTSGMPLVTVRGDREQEYIRQFFLTIHQHEHQGPLLRGLQINNPYHAYQVSIPSPIHFHRISIYDHSSFMHGRQVLATEHYDEGVDPHCTILVGLERCLRAFTQDTSMHHPEGFKSHLAFVVSYAQYMTPRWRSRLEYTWGCSVIDRYSLTEIFGGAAQCRRCGWWHFDPFAIPEVIGSDSGQVINEGEGLLLLTALYPFQEAQPMVRYATGDLVSVTCSNSCRPGVIAIRPLGRARYGVPLPESDSWVLTPAAIFEVIDEIPEIARIPRFRDSEQVTDPFAIGHPKYHVSFTVEVGSIRIQIECELAHPLPADRRLAIEDRIRGELAAENKFFAALQARGEVTLEIVFASNIRPDLIAHSV